MGKRYWLGLLATVTGLLVPMAIMAGEISFKDFARYSMLDDITISPDGKHLAVVVPVHGHKNLVVLDTETLKVTGRMQAWHDNDIGEIWWVNPERIVAELLSDEGAFDIPVATGELVGMNADGSQQHYLFGYRDAWASRLSGNKPDRASGSPLRRIEGDPNHLLITVRDWGTGSGSARTVYKLDVYSGSVQRIATAPATGAAQFLADNKGQVRYAAIMDNHQRWQTYWRASSDDAWQQENVGALENAVIHPLRFSEDGKSVFLSSTETGDRFCLVRRELGSQGKRETLACDDDGDLHSVLWSFDKKTPIAATFEAGYPVLKLLPTDNPDQAILKSLVASFNGQWVSPVSTTDDGNKVILKVASDRNPGDYYLFDRATSKARFLMADRPWFQPGTMAERRPVHYQTRDGHTIWGYLTIPPDTNLSHLPMVVFPHGGPFDVRDGWFWGRESQLLASRGYLVLQVNFRGSSGYGQSHKNVAKRAWASTMIDDITDGTRWAVAQGYADEKRLCISGGSYGGYASLMSAVREPDLYRCVVDYAGPVDLELWKRDADVGETSTGRNYIEEYIGASAKELHDASPLTYIDKLKAAIMIVHGKEDRRVPFNQAKALRNALEDRKYPYEWLVKGGEYHGFYHEEDNEEFFQKLIAFLDKNIGKDAKPADTAPAIAAAPAPVSAPAAAAPSP